VGECDSPRRVGGWYVTLQEVVEMAEADTMVGPIRWWTLNKSTEESSPFGFALRKASYPGLPLGSAMQPVRCVYPRTLKVPSESRKGVQALDVLALT
jgi:hypothetical protein